MPARRATSDQHELVSPSRRRALKAAAATGTAALVWTEPTIKGLARRPAYADVGSGTETIELNATMAHISVPGSVTVTSSGGTSVTVDLAFAMPAEAAPEVVLSVEGCACTIQSVTGVGFGSLLLNPPGGGGLAPLEYVTNSGPATMQFQTGMITNGTLSDGVITLTCT